MTEHLCTINPKVIEVVERAMAGDAALQKMSDFLKIVADFTRLRIVNALLISEMCVCDLSNLLDMTHSAISHQLAVLRKHEIVRARKDGKIKYYSLSDEHIQILFNVTLSHIME